MAMREQSFPQGEFLISFSKQPAHNGLPALLPVSRGHYLRTTLFTMGIAILAYSLFLGVPFAVGFVLLLLAHEGGHLLMLRKLGYPVSTPMFIPFVGAVIGMKVPPRDALSEAIAAFAGPMAGGLAACLYYGIYQIVNEPLMLYLAFIGFIINLFNLVPLSPLDGGRIVTGITRWLWLTGLMGMGLLFYAIWNPLILLIMGIGAHRIVTTLQSEKELAASGYYQVRPEVRILLFFAYFGLILFLGRFTLLTYHRLLIGH